MASTPEPVSPQTEHVERLFSPVEMRLFRHTAVLFCALAMTGMVATVVWVLAGILSVFYNLLLPLSVSAVLALVLYPVVDCLEHRLRIPRGAAIGVLFVAFAGLLTGIVFVLLPMVVAQTRELIDAAPTLFSRWRESLLYHFPGLSDMVASGLENGDLQALLPQLDRAGSTVISYIGLLIGFCFVPLFLYFALHSGARLRERALDNLSIFSAHTQREVLYFAQVFIGYITAFFQGQLIIALIMGALYAAGFTLAGLEAGLLIGGILGLLNIVPFLGTLVGLLLVLPLSYFQPEGGLQLLTLSLLVFAAVQLLESWFLTPRIMADRSGLHPALVVISIFFWGTALGGIIGMILAVPLTAFIVAVWRHLKSRLNRTVVTQTEGDEGPREDATRHILAEGASGPHGERRNRD